MREIKFRGKTPDGRWVYGDLLHAEHNFKKGIDIVTDDWKQETVYPETVGQFTGLKDENGKDIYEGDVIYSEKLNIKNPVRYCEEEARFLLCLNPRIALDQSWIKFVTVVGNIHDKSE